MCFQFHRKNADSHLESAMREHLEFACVKLNSTQLQLNEQRVQLDETRVQLDETRVQLDETRVDLDETRVLLNDTRVQLGETQAKLSLLAVKDGGKKSYIWKITSLSERWRQVLKGKIESDPFYTGLYGYKLKVFAAPCFLEYPPNDPQLLIRFGIILMKGEYDDILPWPFSRKITFTIIDQNEDLKKRQNYIYYLSPRKLTCFGEMIFSERPGKNMKEVESQLPFVITQETLKSRRYVVNDTLFFQIDVDPDHDD